MVGEYVSWMSFFEKPLLLISSIPSYFPIQDQENPPTWPPGGHDVVEDVLKNAAGPVGSAEATLKGVDEWVVSFLVVFLSRGIFVFF